MIDDDTCMVSITEVFSFGETPWDGVADHEVLRNIRRSKHLDRPVRCPDPLFEVMCGCWMMQPSARLQGQDICAKISEYWTENDLDRDMHDYEWPIAGAMALSKNTVDKDTSVAAAEVTNIDLMSLEHAAAFARLEMSAGDVDLERLLGQGAFGSVHLGLVRSMQARVAIKSMKSTDQESQDKFILEARLLSALRHRNIVAIVGCCTKQTPLLIVLELMGSDLKGHLSKLRKGSEAEYPTIGELIGVCQQIGNAMEYLAQHAVIHRDLAARFDASFVRGECIFGHGGDGLVMCLCRFLG